MGVRLKQILSWVALEAMRHYPNEAAERQLMRAIATIYSQRHGFGPNEGEGEEETEEEEQDCEE